MERKLLYFDNTIINDYIEEGLYNYFTKGIHPGGFLYAVLINDLYTAVDKADFQNIVMIGKIAKYIKGNITTRAYGSPELVQDWMNDLFNVRSDYVLRLEQSKMWEKLSEDTR